MVKLLKVNGKIRNACLWFHTLTSRSSIVGIKEYDSGIFDCEKIIVYENLSY